MTEQHTIAVLGGDARQAYAAQVFALSGWKVRHCGVPAVPGVELGVPEESLAQAMQGAQVVLGPLPFRAFDPEPLLSHLCAGQLLIGGGLPAALRAHCEQAGIPAYDLLERDDFAALNAISTAEGAIAEAIAASGINLHLSQALVLGYGRCAKPLVKKLQGMGARVTVAARRWDAACAAVADGCDVLDFHLLAYHMPRFSFVFNTVPALVLGEPLLQGLPPDAVIIDIASAPGGVDFAAAERLGLCAKLCPGLPGKYAPRAAGESVAQVVRIILEEREGATWNQSAPVSD